MLLPPVFLPSQAVWHVLVLSELMIWLHNILSIQVSRCPKPGPQQTRSPLTELRLAQQTCTKGIRGALIRSVAGGHPPSDVKNEHKPMWAELLPGRIHVITQTALSVPDKRPRLPGEGHLTKL